MSFEQLSLQELQEINEEGCLSDNKDTEDDHQACNIILHFHISDDFCHRISCHFIVTDFAKRVYIFTDCVDKVIESNIRPKQVKQMRNLQMRISRKRCIHYQKAVV